MADINDFIDPKLISSLEAINKQLIESGKIIDQQVVPAIKKLEEAQRKLGKNTEENADKRKKLTANEKEAARIAKQLETTEAKLDALRKGATKALTEKRVELQKATKAEKDNAKAVGLSNTSYVKLNKSLNENIARYKTLSAEQRKNKAVGGQLLKTIQQQDKALKKLDSSIGRSQRGVGNYGGAIKKVALQFAGALGLTSAVFIFINVLKGAFNTIRQFGKENAVLAGVLGVTRKEVKALTNQAIQLGAIYPVTASEVTKLQVSFARLGFTMTEISNLTEATIQGSIALNASLDETATLVGALVKTFDNLGTQDASHIMDVLTLATQKSSQSFETLKTALPKVAAAANAMGVPLERVANQLGIAQDATLDASISGTSLRNIYLKLSQSGKTLSEALDEINGSSNKLKKSFDLFGTRAAIVGLALAKNEGNATEFDKALVNVAGTTDRVAKEQMATLDGSIKSLGSSWEKFILGLRASEGFLSTFVDGVSSQLDILSSEFLSFGEKFLILVSGAGSQQARIRLQVQQDVLNSIRTANREEIQLLQLKHIFLANEGNKFSQAVIELTDQRIETIAKDEEDARAREELAIQNAKLQQFALEKEAEEKITEINKKESEKRIKAWENETVLRFKEKQKQIEDQKELEADFAAEVEEDVGEGDKQAEKDASDALKTSQNLIDQNKELKDKEASDEEVRREQTKQAAIVLGNSIFDFRLSKLNAELAAAEGNEKKQAEIRAKIAKAEKQKALFDIFVNTASGVVKALAALNIPLSILIGATGAIQALAVASRPIPQFATGVINFRGGVAELAEKGTEMVKESSGKIWLAENRGLYNLKQGSSVLTAPQTVKELNDNRIVNELKLTRKAIRNQPKQRFPSRFDERQKGFREGYMASKHRLN
ncbi:phage tail tape measure protein [Candidatus Pacearchaeota archaeon]|nr:phage tail tape measure protein [Candidatus Pacearchaeota archaeon]